MADLYNRLKIIRERAASTKAPGSQAAPAPAGAKAPTSQAAPAPAGDMAPTPTSAPGTPALPLSTGESNGWEPCADLVWRRRQLVPVSPEWWEFTAADLGQSGRRELLESLQTHCYIDTETTGLSGGSGTWAFLVGWCRIEGEQAEITQYFMQDLGGEAAMVAAMDAEIQAMGGIGSYNGSSFDLPLLRTRWAMSGREFPQLRHRDCLHPSRRLWKRLLDSCGMAQIESAVLGSGRQDDIPGALIPQLYFDYLRAGAGLDFPRRLGGVFRHHACDVFSLAMLDLLLRAIERQPLDARWQRLAPVLSGRISHFDGHGVVQAQRPVNNAIPVDPLGLLRFCSPEQSRHLAMEQWQKGDRRRWGMIAAHLFRQDGEWGRAAAIWDELWREDQFMPALIAWLKYAEHKSRDPSLWRLALERLDSMIQNQPEDAEFSQDLLKRRLRIQLKLTKRASA